MYPCIDGPLKGETHDCGIWFFCDRRIYGDAAGIYELLNGAYRFRPTIQMSPDEAKKIGVPLDCDFPAGISQHAGRGYAVWKIAGGYWPQTPMRYQNNCSVTSAEQHKGD